MTHSIYSNGTLQGSYRAYHGPRGHLDYILFISEPYGVESTYKTVEALERALECESQPEPTI